MRAGIAIVALSAMFVTSTTANQRQGLPESAHLDTSAVKEAIAFGKTRPPRPYLVRMPNRPRYNVAVYTPFVRVALAAHLAKRRGKQLTIEHLAEWVTHPDVHVVVRWPHDEARRVVPDGTTFDREMKLTQITVAPVGRVNLVDFIRPTWMTTDLSYLDALGGAPFSDAAGAAGFPAELIVPNTELYGWWYKTDNFFVSSGRIDASEYSRWR